MNNEPYESRCHQCGTEEQQAWLYQCQRCHAEVCVDCIDKQGHCLACQNEIEQTESP